MARIMAFDFGTKRVGIAVTDPLQIIATALETVATKECIDYIKKYLVEEQVEQFVLGKPLNLNYTEAQSYKATQAFKAQLEKTFPNIPIAEIDERFTSKIAAKTMVQAGYKKKDRQKKENLDKISACLILQSYLQQNSKK